MERERGRESGLASTCCHSLYQTLCLAFDQVSHGTVLVDMVDLDRMAAGMDVDVAAEVRNQRYTPRTNGSARSATMETGGVVQIAGTVRVSRAILMHRRPRSGRKL